MKKVLVFIAIAFLAFTSCRKERGENGYYWGHGFGMGYGAGCFEERSDMMSKLGINDGDAGKITAIDEKYRKLYYENRGDFNKIDTLRNKHREEIENALGTEPKNKFNNIYSKRWMNWGHGHGRRQMGDYYGHGYGMGYGSGCWDSGDSMKDYLKLNPDQVTKISAIDGKYRELYYSGRGDYNKIDALRVKHRQEIEAVLTPDQKVKFSEVYDNRWRGRGHMGGRGMMGY